MLKDLVEKVGGRFSVGLGIDLSSRHPAKIFKWFFASVLFGARISEIIVIKTYKEFDRNGIITPEGILNVGWDGLVKILDRGGYVRYDFKTATKLLDLSAMLKDRYDCDLNVLHSKASQPRDLEMRLKGLAKGIGEVTVNIFLREMRGIWEKAEPFASELAITAARCIGILPSYHNDREKLLTYLKRKWMVEGMKVGNFPDFEAALVRLGKDYCRKALCDKCPIKCECKGIKK